MVLGKGEIGFVLLVLSILIGIGWVGGLDGFDGLDSQIRFDIHGFMLLPSVKNGNYLFEVVD